MFLKYTFTSENLKRNVQLLMSQKVVLKKVKLAQIEEEKAFNLSLSVLSAFVEKNMLNLTD